MIMNRDVVMEERRKEWMFSNWGDSDSCTLDWSNSVSTHVKLFVEW